MEVKVYPELFDQVVRIESIDEKYNVIAGIEYWIYKDYYPNKNQYAFSFRNRESLSVKMLERSERHTRSRDEVIFQTEDVQSFIKDKVNQWLTQTYGGKKNEDRLLVRTREDIVEGSYVICILKNEFGASVLPVYFKMNDSYRRAYELIDSFGEVKLHASNLSDLESRIYLFNDEEFERLANDLELCTRIA